MIIKYILLGLIQGIAEVLPISSSAHLVIASDIMKISDDNLTFEIFLHLASLIAVVVFLRKELWQLIKGFCLFVFKKNKEYKTEFKYCMMVVVSTIPAVVFTLLLGDLIDKVTATIWVVGLLLVINGIVLWFLSRIKGFRKKEELNYVDAIVIGCSQCFGLFPGISRSGSCLCGAFSRKVEKEAAANYAFVLFIPAVLGAFVLNIMNIKDAVFDNSYLVYYIVSFIIAGVTTYFAFKILLAAIRKEKISYFSYYCVIVGLATFIYGLVK